MTEYPTSKGFRILLVEEDEQDRIAFRQALSRNGRAPCHIAECHAAEPALELLRRGSQSFDLIVVDFSLPGLSGMELFRRFHDGLSSPPFVMLTGEGSERLAVEALQAGFADYIVKDGAQEYLPSLPGKLAEVVRRHRERTARHKAETAVAASQRRLAQILESITDAYFALDDQWRIVELNAAAEREVFARPAAELLGKNVWVLFPQGTKTEFYRYYKIARKLGKPVHFEGRSVIRDKWWEAHAYPRENHLEIYLQDITERKRFEQALLQANEQLEERVADRTKQLKAAVQALEAEIVERNNIEEALRASQEQYSTLVQSSLTGIFIEQQGRIVFTNQKAAEIYGYRKDEILGMEILQLIHPLDRELIAEITEKRLKGVPVAAEYDARGITKSGDTIWIQRRNALIDYDGEPAILANHIDVTKKKQAFDTLEENQHQLKSLSGRLLSAQEDERKRIARELHDSIGSSLSAVKFRLDSLLRTRELASEPTAAVLGVREIVQDAIDETRRLMSDLRPAMLDDLGLLSTLRWFCRRFQTVYSHIMVEECLEILEEEIPERLKIVIFRIVQEAFNNIAKYSRADSVTLSVVKDQDILELTITDNGQGFDPESLLAMEESGRGLGLTGMRERTELSGGSFLIASPPGAGASINACWSLAVTAKSLH